MLFIGCDPASTTCAIVIVKENSIIDLTGDIEKEIFLRAWLPFVVGTLKKKFEINQISCYLWLEHSKRSLK